ncbi:MAG: hypothetical protein IKA57_05290 [Clostridia bacterium]|nr:hypothetical protein [Clostridia bacterium]
MKWKQALENIPAELRERKQWVCFKSIPKAGHWGKKMISPTTGELAKSNSPATWTDFESALRYANKYRMDGLAFALTDGIVFVDIDDYESKNDDIQSVLIALCDELETYAETSVSGKGVHFLCKGKLSENARKRRDEYGLEMYDTLRFVCVTGNVLGEKKPLADLSEKIGDINVRYMGKPEKIKPAIRKKATETDDVLIERISKSRQGDKFQKLYKGDWSGYESQSSADYAFVRMLTIWTQDESQIDSIFRSSGLYRQKWDKHGGYYGKRTIQRALDTAQKCRNVAEM